MESWLIHSIDFQIWQCSAHYQNIIVMPPRWIIGWSANSYRSLP